MFENNRILVVDDNESIHDDFRKILASSETLEESEYKNLEQELFGFTNSSTITIKGLNYNLDFALQGQDAYEMVKEAEKNDQPYALIFMDVRMPPGWDGIETISRIWDKFPNVEIVICSAYSDYSWDKIISKLGSNDRLLFLKKPFDSVEVKQMALSLVKKWNLREKSRHYVDDLENDVAKRTKQLKSMVQELINSRDKLKHEIFVRRQAEQELAAEKESLSVTLKSIKDGVISIDSNGNITLVNKVAQEIIGLEQSKLLQKPLKDVLILSDINKVKIDICLSEHLSKGKIAEFEQDSVILTSNDGKERLVSLESSPISDKNDNLTGSVILIRDISEKVRMEEELVRAKKLDSVATFAGGIAHDFNNILTGIIGNITLARMSMDDGIKAAEYLDTAENESMKASKLSQQLLNFSKGNSIVRKNILNKDIILENDKKKILLLDNIIISQVLQKILDELGYHSEVFDMTSKATLMSNTNSFSSAIIDLNFLEENAEIVEKIKEYNPNIKFIISTIFPEEQMETKYKNVGNNEIISKPFRFNQLKEVLDRVIPL